ncbi:MAG: FxsA family protein [Mycolicibacterium insubricum]|nr:FxsA family protein [Mycobacterium sp.]
MIRRTFAVYVLAELAAVVALVYFLGIGTTLLILVGVLLAGLLLAGSQLRRQLAQLRSGVRDAGGAVTDGALVALGTVLVAIPGVVSSAIGIALLIPPVRTVLRPVVTTVAARRLAGRVRFADLGAVGFTTGGYGRGDYIDGEVIEGEIIDLGDPPGGPVPRAIVP